MKILFLGHCSYYTIANLATAIKDHIEDVKITVADPVKPDGGIITSNELTVFDETINLPRRRNIKISGTDRSSILKSLLKDSAGRKNILKRLVKLQFSSTKKYIDSEAEKRSYGLMLRKILNRYDVFNFHYPTPEFLIPLEYIGDDKKIILIFWGSDLLCTSGEKAYRTQQAAFDRADIITMNTLEMREIFLAKFGRKYLPKIRQAYFLYDHTKFEVPEQSEKRDIINRFRNRNEISHSKKIVTIGYNGSSAQRHEEILRILGKLENNYKDQIHLVLPMTYGLQFEKKDYLQKIRELCKLTGIDHTIITEYLKGESYIELTYAAEINLNLRDTDCMNASFIESLHSGNINICGAWLPYGKLQRLGIEYIIIESHEELLNLLPAVLDNYYTELERTKNNPEKVRKFFSTENLIKDWEVIFNEISSGNVKTKQKDHKKYTISEYEEVNEYERTFS